MTQSKLSKALVVCLACAVLLACKKDRQAEVADAGNKPDSLSMETELKILALNGRIESGKNNQAVDWVTPFENATGCVVKATLLESRELIDASLGSDVYDLVIAADMTLPSDKLSPIDTSRLRAFKQLDRRFSASVDPRKPLSLPFQWRMIPPVAPATESIAEVESTHLLAKANNPNCAYAWIEWTLSPKVQGDIAAALGTIPVVPAACVGNESLGDDACDQRRNLPLIGALEGGSAGNSSEQATPVKNP